MTEQWLPVFRGWLGNSHAPDRVTLATEEAGELYAPLCQALCLSWVQAGC